MMYKRVIICADLEGVNNVVGVPYEGLVKGSEGWEVGRHQAALEINAAADALFAAGAEYVCLWDNHGGGGNIEQSELDPRIDFIKNQKGVDRDYYFKNNIDAVVFFGYHSMEGTLGGVLAHTFNSKAIQYYKINGRYVGEIDVDTYIAAGMGVKTLFFAGDDKACAQAKASVPHIATVITKYGKSRNEAEYRDNGELLTEIHEKIAETLSEPHELKLLTYPTKLEMSYKRTEDAAKCLARRRERGIVCDYPADDVMGYDAHTVVCEIGSFEEFVRAIE